MGRARGLLDEAEVALLAGRRGELRPRRASAIEGGGESGAGVSSRTSATGPGSCRMRRSSAARASARWPRAMARAPPGCTTTTLVKEPGTTLRTPWHQDQPFYNVDGFDTVPPDPTIWCRARMPEFVAGFTPAHVVHAAQLLRRSACSTTAPSRRCPTSRPTAPRTILGWALEPGTPPSTCSRCTRPLARATDGVPSVRLVGDDRASRARMRRARPSPSRGRWRTARSSTTRLPAPVPAPTTDAMRPAERPAEAPRGAPARPAGECRADEPGRALWCAAHRARFGGRSEPVDGAHRRSAVRSWRSTRTTARSRGSSSEATTRRRPRPPRR